MIEYKAVLSKTKELLGDSYYSKSKNIASNPLNKELEQNKPDLVSYQLNYLVGVINSTDSLRFKRIIFRATKGNSWIIISNINKEVYDQHIDKEYSTLEEQNRAVFIVVYQPGA